MGTNGVLVNTLLPLSKIQSFDHYGHLVELQGGGMCKNVFLLLIYYLSFNPFEVLLPIYLARASKWAEIWY